MKTKMTLATIVLAAALPAGAALAGISCQTEPGQMQPWSVVLANAQAHDWSINSMKVKHGCYELKITDPGGNRVKLTLDPVTLEVLRVAPWGRPAPVSLLPEAPAGS